jgi:uncharacterized protein (TIGR00299 family) protein
MKVLYYDCFSGISGDMNMGAMIDLGVDKNYLIGEIKKLELNDYDIKVYSDKRRGIKGTRVEIVVNGENVHGSCQETHGAPGHRNLRDIIRIINETGLSERVKKLSLEIFQKIACAEAKVHGKSIDEIEFHEVGAVDSIIDIVGAALCFDYLGVEKVYASPVELGGGTVKCAHGILPVPAPATVELLRGKPVKMGTLSYETTTPTGAAILATLVDEFTSGIALYIDKIGYGIGYRDPELPNVLRAILGEVTETDKDVEEDEAFLLECNIDDMNPEFYESIMESLFAQGADDVFLTSIIMKKSRPAVTLNVLCGADRLEKIKEYILTRTSTLGTRSHLINKTTLRRDFSEVNTEYGVVRIKNAYYKGKKIKSKPEFKDCKKIADEKGVSLQQIYESIYRNLNT